MWLLPVPLSPDRHAQRLHSLALRWRLLRVCSRPRRPRGDGKGTALLCSRDRSSTGWSCAVPAGAGEGCVHRRSRRRDDGRGDSAEPEESYLMLALEISITSLVFMLQSTKFFTSDAFDRSKSVGRYWKAEYASSAVICQKLAQRLISRGLCLYWSRRR